MLTASALQLEYRIECLFFNNVEYLRSLLVVKLLDKVR